MVSKKHSRDLFLIRELKSYTYILLDIKGNQLLPEKFTTIKNMRARFVPKIDPLSELTAIEIELNKDTSDKKFGIINIISEKDHSVSYEAIPAIYDSIYFDNVHVIQDRHGNYHYPTYKAVKKEGSKRKEFRYTIIGKRIQLPSL